VLDTAFSTMAGVWLDFPGCGFGIGRCSRGCLVWVCGCVVAKMFLGEGSGDLSVVIRIDCTLATVIWLRKVG
jgi:hypothetical protein